MKPCTKMDKKIIKFDDTEIEGYKFHQHKISILVNDIDINKIVVSNKVPFSEEDFKYFNGYKGTDKIRPLFILCPGLSIYRRGFNESKCKYFLIKEEKVFDKYNEISEKKLAISSKKNLTVNLYTIKNI